MRATCNRFNSVGFVAEEERGFGFQFSVFSKCKSRSLSPVRPLAAAAEFGHESRENKTGRKHGERLDIRCKGVSFRYGNGCAIRLSNSLILPRRFSATIRRRLGEGVAAYPVLCSVFISPAIRRSNAVERRESYSFNITYLPKHFSRLAINRHTLARGRRKLSRRAGEGREG